MEFLMNAFDFLFQHWEKIAAVLGAGSLGGIVSVITKALKPDAKIGDFFDNLNKRLAAWMTSYFVPAVGAAGEKFGKFITNRMTGKFGKFWNVTFEPIFILILRGGVGLIIGGFTGLISAAAEFLSRIQRGLEYDNR